MERTIIELKAFIVPITIAVFGGIVKFFREKRKKSVGRFFVGILGAAFAGVLSFMMLKSTSLNPYMQAAIVALTGYGADAVLDAFERGMVRFWERFIGGAPND